MANTSEIYSKTSNNNTPFKINIPFALLSSSKTKADTNLILIIYITQTLRQVSLIYKYIYTAIKEKNAYIKKRYFYKYCPP